MMNQEENTRASKPQSSKVHPPLTVLNFGIPIPTGVNDQLSYQPAERQIYEPCSVVYSKQTLQSLKSERKKAAAALAAQRDNQKSIQVCFLGKFMSFLAFLTSWISFLLITYNYYGQSWSAESSLPHHDTLGLEGCMLLIQSTIAVIALCVITRIICFQDPDTPISNKCYYMIVSAVVFLTITDGMWVTFEIQHSHSFQWHINNTKRFEMDVEEYYGNHEMLFSTFQPVPGWMDKIQTTHKCCGVHDPEDWQRYLYNTSDIPDSCCAEKKKGCGKNYFSHVKAAGESPVVEIFKKGCAASTSRLSAMTYTDVNCILLAKFMEVIFLVMYTMVVAFCINSFGDSLEESFPIPRNRYDVI